MTATETDPDSVAVIQPNVPVDGPWDDAKFVDEMFLRHLSLSEQAIQANSKEPNLGGPPGFPSQKTTSIDLVIWPESAMNFEYDRDPSLQRKLAEFTRRNAVYLLINTWGFSEGSTEPQYNSAVLISPSGEKIAEYYKNAL